MFSRITNRIKRELSSRIHRRIVELRPRAPLVSFTFDDFPSNSLHIAGTMLREYAWHGTYYTSFGLMGTTAPTGTIFTEDDLPEFLRQGHELGCHTFDHFHSWDTPSAKFHGSILRNRAAVKDLLPGTEMLSFSYPISGPRPATKRMMSSLYPSARGGGQTFNLGETDLNYMKGFFIEQSRDNLDAIKRIIDDNAVASGWLIFATHDVTENPTRYGCTPALFRAILSHVKSSGATVLPVKDAMAQLGLLSHSPSPATRTPGSMSPSV